MKLLATTVAVAAGALVLMITRPNPTVAILVAEGPVPAGVALEDLPVGVRRVPTAAGLVAGETPADLAGWTLATPLAEGLCQHVASLLT